MRLTQLQQILSIAQYGSISKAAQALFIAQPGLSASLNELEKELGVTIFKRTAKGVIPTNEGQQILREARTIFDSIDHIQNVSAATTQKEITISAGHYYDFLLPDITAAFRQLYPEITLDFIYPKDVLRIADDLTKGYYRICLASSYPALSKQDYNTKRFRYIVLSAPVEGYAFMHKDHPLAQKSVLTLADIQNTFLSMAHISSSEFFFQFCPALKDLCKIHTGNPTTTLATAIQNKGITIMNASPLSIYAMQQNDPNITAVRFADAGTVPMESILISLRPELLTKAETDLIEIICNIVEGLEIQAANARKTASTK